MMVSSHDSDDKVNYNQTEYTSLVKRLTNCVGANQEHFILRYNDLGLSILVLLIGSWVDFYF